MGIVHDLRGSTLWNAMGHVKSFQLTPSVRGGVVNDNRFPLVRGGIVNANNNGLGRVSKLYSPIDSSPSVRGGSGVRGC